MLKSNNWKFWRSLTNFFALFHKVIVPKISNNMFKFVGNFCCDTYHLHATSHCLSERRSQLELPKLLEWSNNRASIFCWCCSGCVGDQAIWLGMILFQPMFAYKQASIQAPHAFWWNCKSGVHREKPDKCLWLKANNYFTH